MTKTLNFAFGLVTVAVVRSVDYPLIVNYRSVLTRANLGESYCHYFSDLVSEPQCCLNSSVLSACFSE